MRERFLSNLGLARRAGNVAFGFDACARAVQAGEASCVFCSADAAENTRKRMERICAGQGAEMLYIPFSLQEIGRATGRKDTALFVVTDQGLMELLKRSLEDRNGGNAE